MPGGQESCAGRMFDVFHECPRCASSTTQHRHIGGQIFGFMRDYRITRSVFAHVETGDHSPRVRRRDVELALFGVSEVLMRVVRMVSGRQIICVLVLTVYPHRVHRSSIRTKHDCHEKKCICDAGLIKPCHARGENKKRNVSCGTDAGRMSM